MRRKRWLSLSHHLVLAMVLVGLFATLVPVSVVKADSVVVFPDPNLHSAMRQQILVQLHYRVGTIILQSDLDRLTKFASAIDGITDLTGMEHCTHLTDLYICGSPLGDLSPLSGLTNLTSLQLESCQLTGISSLSGLTNLRRMVLSVNNIGDISALSNLTNLVFLRLDQNQISDISPLASLPNLAYLTLSQNGISDLSPLSSGFTKLGSDYDDGRGNWTIGELDLDHNRISDLTPLLNNVAWGQPGRILPIYLRGNPLSCYSMDTVVPALVEKRVFPVFDDASISGHVEDGYGHRLAGVEVTLMAVADDGSTTERAVTITDDNGHYSFGTSGDTIEEGKYLIEVALECHETAGDTAIFTINYDRGSPVAAQTNSFQFDGTCEQGVKDIDFVDPYVHPATAVPADRLDDLAGMYYHTKQVVDFGQSELGVTLDLNLPIEVHGYVSSTPAKAYYDPNDGNVYIGADRSDYSVRTKPWTPDWHEMFHQLMDDTVGIPPWHTGDTSHGGYANHCTGNSWVEGWAEFWPCALARSQGVPGWYLFWGTTSLEQNWMVWDSEAGISREEFSVASLLVDLVDPVNPPEYDFLSLTNSQLWAIIGSKQLANMFEVYSALVAAKVGQTDYDADGISDLDALFIAHGFFADDGNGAYDGETVGLGGKPGRQSTLLVPNAYLRIIVEDSQGNPISDGTLLVDVVFASPLDIYNYSFQIDLHSSDGLEYFEVAPDRCEAQMTMRVKDGNGILSDEFTLSNSAYWEKVNGSTTGYADEHTFVIGAPAATSGGMPVWIWPIVGVAVVALGAGGFFLLRRKAKPG